MSKKTTMSETSIKEYKVAAKRFEEHLNNVQHNRVYRVYFDPDFFSFDSQVSAFVFQDETEDWNFAIDFKGNWRLDVDVMKKDFALSFDEVTELNKFARKLREEHVEQD